MPNSADDHLKSLVVAYKGGSKDLYDDVISYASLNIGLKAAEVFATHADGDKSADEVWALMQKESSDWGSPTELHG